VKTHISKGVLRVSLGWQSEAQDTQKLVAAWGQLAQNRSQDAAE
jgi:cysteine sulfinate desulfinase/cysteine desulfurase-like protein